MKILRQKLIVVLASLLFIVASSQAIEGLKLQIICPDVVLSWPSVEGATYIVQYRPTLDPITPWQTLTNNLPAGTGTNVTFFVHSNRVDCSAGQIFGMGLLPDGGNAMVSSAASLSPEERRQLKQARETQRLAELLVQCELEQREPYEWELKNEPPPPPSTEEVRAKILAAMEKRQAGLNTAGSVGLAPQFSSAAINSANSCASYVASNNNSGFYRVFCPAPVAQLDVFGVEQGSTMNQLDILLNDTDPDDNPIMLSHVQPAGHGEIEYSDDASIFRYTPTNTFSGLETFSYAITNDVGGSIMFTC